MRAIYFEYRKEYIEFFMTFFPSDDEVKDGVKLRAIEEYERLKEATNVKNMLEQQKAIEQVFKINVHLEDSKAIFPFYKSLSDETLQKANAIDGSSLQDITNSNAFIASTGDVYFNNDTKNAPIGHMPLHVQLHPSLVYAGNLQLWWKDGSSVHCLDYFEIDFDILIRDKEFDFGVNKYDLPELKWKFFIRRGDLTIRPEAYVHLLNIADIFTRPIIRMGDLEAIKLNERKTIF